MKYNFVAFIKTVINFFEKTIRVAKIRSTRYERYMIDNGTVNGETYRTIILGDRFEECKDKLLANLDTCSVELINRVIKRIKMYLKDGVLFYNKTYEEFLNLIKVDVYKKINLKYISGNYKIESYILPRDFIDNQIFWNKYFMNEFTNLSAIRQKDIVDVGAFIGDSSILFEQYTDKKVRAFEPVESNYVDMLKTIELNNSNKIVPYKFGLGSFEQEVFINKFESTGVASTLRSDMNNYKSSVKEKISIKTLDDIVKEENLEIGLIKVDVEGAEQDFLKGALETIKKQKPALLIAIYHTGEDFFEIKPWLESLNLGYKFKVRKANKNKLIDDTVLICEVQ